MSLFRWGNNSFYTLENNELYALTQSQDCLCVQRKFGQGHLVEMNGSVMEHIFQPTGLTALRYKLRDTWLIDRYRNVKRRVMRRSEGEAFLLRRYFRIHGKPLKVANPQTFTEKLFCRMITWNRGDMLPRFTQLADK